MENLYNTFKGNETFTPTFENPGQTLEELKIPRPPELLKALGDAVIQRALAPDLDLAVEAHIAQTGRQHTNEHSPGFFVGSPANGIPMRAEMSYRSVDQRAINDLAESGVVRGAFTASEGAHANTSSHATFWSDGKEGVNHPFRSPGTFVIETPTEHLDQPVTADKVAAIYAQDHTGKHRNILDNSI